MAMHYRRNNNPPSSNPFTGRSLPSSPRRNAGANTDGGGGVGQNDHYHGNHHPSSLLGSNMAKKAVLLVLTFTIFFYVVFSPDYYDNGSYNNAFPRFKTSVDSDTNEKKSNMTVQDDKEPKSLYRGGLRGSNSSGNKNPFGRQEPDDDKVADVKEDFEEEEKEEEEVAKSSGDGIEVIDKGKLFLDSAIHEIP